VPLDLGQVGLLVRQDQQLERARLPERSREPAASIEFLRSTIHDFVEHYHHERNHRWLDNGLIIEAESSTGNGEPIQCRRRLGGMLNYYYRQAA
jgi:transposase InsO family protein